MLRWKDQKKETGKSDNSSLRDEKYWRMKGELKYTETFLSNKIKTEIW